LSYLALYNLRVCFRPPGRAFRFRATQRLHQLRNRIALLFAHPAPRPEVVELSCPTQCSVAEPLVAQTLLCFSLWLGLCDCQVQIALRIFCALSLERWSDDLLAATCAVRNTATLFFFHNAEFFRCRSKETIFRSIHGSSIEFSFCECYYVLQKTKQTMSIWCSVLFSERSCSWHDNMLTYITAISRCFLSIWWTLCTVVLLYSKPNPFMLRCSDFTFKCIHVLVVWMDAIRWRAPGTCPPHFFKPWGYNMPCPPTFSSLLGGGHILLCIWRGFINKCDVCHVLCLEIFMSNVLYLKRFHKQMWRLSRFVFRDFHVKCYT